MKKINLLAIGIPLLISSCLISLELGENGYNSLSTSEKTHIKPYDAASNYDFSKNEGSLPVFEINSQNILNSLNNNTYTWIHIWNPYCANDNCVNITPYQNLANKYKKKGLNLTFTSPSYSIKEMEEIVINSGFSLPVYVLQRSYYGLKLKEIRKKLYFDLNPKAKPEDDYFNSDYLFQGDSLVYRGYELNDSIIGSYMGSEVE